MALTFVRAEAASSSTFVVSVASSTPWAEVRTLLPGDLRESLWYAYETPVSDDSLIGEPPLLHAAQLTDRPHQPPRRPLLELTIAEGPDSGQVRPLVGRAVLGRVPVCDLPLCDPSLSREHAAIDITHGLATVRDLDSTNGTWIDDGRLDATVPRELRVGQRLRTGHTVSRLTPVRTAPPLPLRAGRRALSRPPRQVPELISGELTRPTAPQAFEFSIPWLVLLLPVPIALVLAILLRSPMFLAFAAFSPLMMMGQYLHDRIGGRRARRAQLEEFQARTEEIERELAERLLRETTDRRRLAPDLAEIATSVRIGRCWARRPGDQDHLLCRLGTGTVSAHTSVRDSDGAREHFPLERMPITVDLNEHPVTGLTGTPELLDRVLDSLVGQLVATHSPTALRLLVISSRSAEPGRWGWAVWLPHLRPDTTGSPLVFHPDHDLEEISSALDAWSRPLDTPLIGASKPSVHTVVVLDGTGLTQRPLLHALVQNGAHHGVVVLAAAPHADGLPADCTAMAVLDDPLSGRLLVGDIVQPFVPDLPAPTWRDSIGSALSATVDTTPGAHGGEPPAQVRLLDVLDDDLTSEKVRHQWHRRPRSHEILVGLGAEGPVTVDLVRDGPHALVGGTTGSGKSELLQTLIASLALGNRPDELTFLLVDYKGGAAFKDCVDLPHTVGLVTDLDPFLTQRALSSLDAEVRRREKLLAAVGAKDLEDYQAHTSDAPPIPRLVLVIDEFRVLAEELPDFIDGVVRLAAVGRSLGIHIILATQRPAGVISGDIRANVNLRIALRVRDTSDSEDIIESPAAAALSAHTPGRALLRTGATPPIAVQAARVGGSAAGVEAVRVLPVDPCTGRVTGPPTIETSGGPSDLSFVVTTLRGAAELAELPQMPSPWLPPLPAMLARTVGHSTWRTLEGGTSADDQPAAPLGLIDLPAEQQQVTVAWNLGSGHLAVVGGPRSGRTTAVRTIVAGLAERWTPEDIHVYAIDTAGTLGALQELPHAGAIIPSTDTTLVKKVLDWLAHECVRRQQVLAAGDYADLSEQRRGAAAGSALSYLVLIIDGWDGFQAEYELADGAVVDSVAHLLRDGPAVGLSVLLTGGRAVLSGRVASLVQHRICLRMADEMDLVMAGLRPAQVPSFMPPGRALVLPNGDELQVALPGASAEGAAQSEAIRAIARDTPPPRSCPPKKFVGLPERIRWEDLDATSAPSPDALVLGVGGEAAQPRWWHPDPVHGCVALIAGPPGSGRTTALQTLAAQLHDRGPLYWLACARDRHESSPGVTYLRVEDDADHVWDLLSAGFATLVIDDVELLAPPYDRLAESFLDRCAQGAGALLVAGATSDLIGSYQGVAADLRRRQSGLILQPARGDGDLLAAHVPHTGRVVPGRGILVHRGKGTEIQVAQPPAVDPTVAPDRYTP